MHCTPRNRAQRPQQSSRDCPLSLQPERLELRLALSHAPMGDFGPGPDATNQNAAFFSGPSSTDAWSNAGWTERGDFGGSDWQGAGQGNASSVMLDNVRNVWRPRRRLDALRR